MDLFDSIRTGRFPTGFLFISGMQHSFLFSVFHTGYPSNSPLINFGFLFREIL